MQFPGGNAFLISIVGLGDWNVEPHKGDWNVEPHNPLLSFVQVTSALGPQSTNP